MKIQSILHSVLFLRVALFGQIAHADARTSDQGLFAFNDYCFPSATDLDSRPICLNTEVPIRCQKDATSNESSIQLELGIWKFAMNGKRLLSSSCSEERTSDEVRVNCRYGTLFLDVNLKSMLRSENFGQIDLFGTEGGVIFGIPYGQTVPCKAIEKN